MRHKSTTRQSIHNYLLMIPSLLGIVLFYAWLASAGSGDHPGTTTYYYASLAEAFRNGNLHLPIQPDPRLLALDNPYNLSARVELERTGVETPIDLSLYQGKFYLYWGAVPALILATMQLLSSQQPIGDFFLAFVFGVGILLAQSLLLIMIWDRYFRTLPKWTLHLSIFLAGLPWAAGLLRYEYDHARVYEAAIAAGQFFLISGLLMAFSALARPSISNWRLVSAGLFWALAIGSRHILVAPIGFMIILTAFWIIRRDADSTVKMIKFISLGLPLALGAIGLSWYNWARFGSITETGFSYALAGVDLQEHSTELFSGSYMIQNLYNYVINPPRFMSMFPFVSMLKGSKNLILPFYTSPKFYYAQPMTGLLFVFPFAVFAVVPLKILLLNLFKRNLAENLVEANNSRLLTWITLNLSGSFLIVFSLLTTFFWAGMRYMDDFLPGLVILSVLGFWQGYQVLAHKCLTKNLYILSGIILASASIFMSTLLAISTTQG
jgi:hypothetical protein